MSALSVKLSGERGRLVALAARVVLAGVFLWAGLPKLLDPATFAGDIAAYRLVPEALVGPAATVLPALELVLALALLSGLHARGAALVAAILLVVFAAGMGQAMARGIDLSCGCFGATVEPRVGLGTIARNLALVLVSAVVVAAPAAPWRRQGDPRPAP